MKSPEPATAQPFDITFVGHVCYDELTPFGGTTVVRPGSAVLCGAAVAARIGMRTACVTRMNPRNEDVLRSLRDLGVQVFLTPTDVTTISQVVHRSENVDERDISVKQDAGYFTLRDIPPKLATRVLHLAGVSNHEFTLEFVRDLRQAGFSLSLDMQSFVRVIGPDRRIAFSDVPEKQDLAALLDFVKLDVVEAELLTGTRDLAKAARQFAAWGAREVLLTEQSGATLLAEGRMYRAPFTNRTQIGRTGRGDTTMSAYLCRRQTHPPLAALQFAAALVSIKMEQPGPFTGTLRDVEERLARG